MTSVLAPAWDRRSPTGLWTSLCASTKDAQKGANRERVVPIVHLGHAFRLTFAMQHADGGGVLLFRTRGNFRRDLAAACRRAGIGRLSPNDLRRTHAEWLRRGGVQSADLAPVMGHADSRMVERVYGRITAVDLAPLLAEVPRDGIALSCTEAWRSTGKTDDVSLAPLGHEPHHRHRARSRICHKPWQNSPWGHHVILLERVKRTRGLLRGAGGHQRASSRRASGSRPPVHQDAALRCGLLRSLTRLGRLGTRGGSRGDPSLPNVRTPRVALFLPAPSPHPGLRRVHTGALGLLERHPDDRLKRRQPNSRREPRLERSGRRANRRRFLDRRRGPLEPRHGRQRDRRLLRGLLDRVLQRRARDLLRGHDHVALLRRDRNLRRRSLHVRPLRLGLRARLPGRGVPGSGPVQRRRVRLAPVALVHRSVDARDVLVVRYVRCRPVQLLRDEHPLPERLPGGRVPRRSLRGSELQPAPGVDVRRQLHAPDVLARGDLRPRHLLLWLHGHDLLERLHRQRLHRRVLAPESPARLLPRRPASAPPCDSVTPRPARAQGARAPTSRRRRPAPAAARRGAAAPDPCAGVTCATPPAPYCASATMLETFSASGTCSTGSCSYASTQATCAYGCASGACAASPLRGACAAGTVCGPANTCVGDAGHPPARYAALDQRESVATRLPLDHGHDRRRQPHRAVPRPSVHQSRAHPHRDDGGFALERPHSRELLLSLASAAGP